jgi:NAD(P)-dependent dehydrogenase (short-subunit alcohol dehydrogenase family)
MINEVVMKTWFITGTSSGFGAAWTRAALDRGDAVAATVLPGYEPGSPSDQYRDRLLPLTLDVRDRNACRQVVDQAFEQLGSIDVVVNNAGYGQLGMLEELTESEVRDQLDTNLLGPLWVTQAALPHLRAQGGGRIFQVTSIGGLLAFPFFGAYNASKWGLEAFSQALADEVRQFGIDVTIIEPVGYSTNWWGPGLRRTTEQAPYSSLRLKVQSGWDAAASARREPQTTASAILQIADMENPPLRVLLGEGGVARIEAEYAARLDTWRSWEATELSEVSPA